MKKIIALATLLAASTVFAGDWYGTTTYDRKDKQSSDQVNNVLGLNVGKKLGNGLSAEIRMENELVQPGGGATQKQEGLVQGKVSYDIATGTLLTPYVAVAVGQKNKSTVDFSYWVGEVGAKAQFGDIGLRYGWRQRTAFDNNATNSYDTKENTIAVTYAMTKLDTVGVRFARERGTSDYNTTGLFYTRSF